MEATRCRPVLPGGRRLWEEGSKSDLEVKVVNKIVEMIKGHTMLVKYFLCLVYQIPPRILAVCYYNNNNDNNFICSS